MALIILGANFLTDSSSDIARRFGISEFIVGLTIVAIGTSTPELVISMLSAIKGNSDVAIGNVIGSNMFNTLVIVGLTGIMSRLPLSAQNVKRDIPLGIVASIVLLLVGGDVFLDDGIPPVISRSEGLLLICLFIFFMYYSISSYSRNKKEAIEAVDVVVDAPQVEKPVHLRNLFLSISIILISLLALIAGGELFLDSAIDIARYFGMSEAVIAVTIIAGGTSIPELAASITAAIKKKPGLALGNVLGSNIMNIFLVLGASATVAPLTLGDINVYDILVLIASSVLLYVSAFTFKKKSIGKIDGIIFLLLYVVYIAWMLLR